MTEPATEAGEPGPFAVLLLDAVERIFATESPSTVSMRTIAAEAECSLGVAYNHFDNKMALLGAALDRMAGRITSHAVSVDEPREALVAVVDALRSNPAFPRLLTWMVLEGHDVTGTMGGHPLIQTVAEMAAARDAEDPAGLAMMMGLLAIGTFTYGEMLNRAAAREPDDARLVEAVAEMYAAWFPRAAR